MADRTIKLQEHEWTLHERVGDGGFGEVYAATAPGVEQAAVVKLVLKAPGAQRELLFVDVQGARNVIPVLDVGEDETQPTTASRWHGQRSRCASTSRRTTDLLRTTRSLS